MYVRGKYGKSLRLDVLKKTTPAANDNLNTIGNSRSTPKEKANGNDRREGTPKLGRPRKPSHDTIGGGSIFPFDQPGINPFGNGLLNFSSGLPEHNTLGLLGLAGLPPADSRIKDLMQSLQSQQAALSETERIKEVEFSNEMKENRDNKQNNFNSVFLEDQERRETALALLLQAKEGMAKFKENSIETEQEETNIPKSNTRDEDSGEDEEEDRMEGDVIPQLAVNIPVTTKPIEVKTSKIELNVPSAATEISAQ